MKNLIKFSFFKLLMYSWRAFFAWYAFKISFSCESHTCAAFTRLHPLPGRLSTGYTIINHVNYNAFHAKQTQTIRNEVMYAHALHFLFLFYFQKQNAVKMLPVTRLQLSHSDVIHTIHTSRRVENLLFFYCACANDSRSSSMFFVLPLIQTVV